MRRTRWVVAAVAFGAGCSGGGASPNLVLTDDNNYKQESTLTFGHYSVQEQVETTFDWSQLTLDLRGRDLDPATIDQVYLSRIDQTEDVLVGNVLANKIPQSDAFSSTWGNDEHVTTAELSTFDSFGAEFDLGDLVADPAQTWVLTLIEVPDGTTEQQVLMSAVIDPVADPGSAVALTNGTTVVSVTPDLQGPLSLTTLAGESSYSLDWSDLTVDVFGEPFDNLVANTLWIVNYPGTVADVEADFLLADYHASAIYKLNVRGENGAVLNEATDAEGNAFPGFTTDGTWLVGLVDNTSLSPLPLVMGVVTVE